MHGLFIFLITYHSRNTFPCTLACSCIHYYVGYPNSDMRLYYTREFRPDGKGRFLRKLQPQFLISFVSAIRWFRTDGCSRSKLTMSQLDNVARRTAEGQRAFVFYAAKVRCLALKLVALVQQLTDLSSTLFSSNLTDSEIDFLNLRP